MAELPTNFKDDILAETMGGRRRYQMIQNEDGTVSFVDVTQYEQIGSDFGQAEINQTNEEVNKKFDSGDVVDPVTTTELGFAADAKLTGDALSALNANMQWKKVGEATGKTSIPLPEEFSELQIEVLANSGAMCYEFHLIREMLSETDKFWSNGIPVVQVSIAVSLNRVMLDYIVNTNGHDYISDSITKVYYR